MTNAAFVAGYLCGLALICMFVWIGVVLHMAYTKMDLMLGYLKNCSAIMTLAQFKQSGPWGKLLLVCSISSFVTFPGFYIKRRGVSAEDLRTFPMPLKRKLMILQWIGIGQFIALALFVALYKILRAYQI